MPLTADQLRGRVRVLIDGEDKVLRYDQGALASLVEALGLEGLASLPVALAVMDASVLRSLVWAGCLHREPDLKQEDMSEWFYALVPTYAKCLEGVNLAIWGHPEGDPDAEEDNDAADPQPAEVKVGISEEPKDLQ